MDINKIIQKIDPLYIFTVKSEGNCSIPVTSFQSQIKKCTNFRNKNKTNYDQILYEYGGQDVSEAYKNNKFDDLFQAMIRPFKGLVVMETKEYAHLDIKPANMVYNSKTKKMSIIDFGLASPFEFVDNKHYMPIFKH